MQYIQRGNLKLHKVGEFHEWLARNEALIKEHAPEGWTYLGTWFTVRGLGKFDCETRWELSDYAALGADWGNETFQDLIRQWVEFIEPSVPGETCMMKSAADIRIFKGA